MGFAPVKRLKVAEQIAAAIRDAIVGGNYDPGDKLPSERDLADQFQANRSTIREALHRLEANGMVEMRHGGGTRVRDFFASAGLQLLPWLVAPNGTFDPALLQDLMDLRGVLLKWTAEQAATKATEAGKQQLRSRLVALAAAKTPKARQQLDYDFFESLVHVTGNRVLGLLTNGVRQVYIVNSGAFLAMYADDFQLQHHLDAVSAIERGDATAAGEAMARFAGSWKEETP